MREMLVAKDTLNEMVYKATVRAACIIPRDCRRAIENGERQEETEVSRGPLSFFLEACDAGERGRTLCPDTGWQIYWIKMGENVRIENGVSSIQDAAKQAVARATGEGYLRPHLVHPLTMRNPLNNVGVHAPTVYVQFDPSIDYIEIVSVCKGGGGELFGGIQRNLAEADGRKGIIKFVLDCFVHTSYSGKTCPPGIIGIGIGGTTATSAQLALEAACLRTIGNRHPDQDIAELEDDLLTQFNSLGIGPMGMGGKTSALDVHIEYALTHFAGISVSFNTFCCVIRRATARLDPSGHIEYGDAPSWNYR